MNLNVHSIESFGTVDGPGVRFVIFVQGCPLRCSYCHNPDTWNTKNGNSKSIDELVRQIDDYSMFIQSGGVTVSGGEPLLQPKKVTELFKKLKEKGIHTCIDTSGFVTITEDIKELLNYTDLLLLDLKVIDEEKHKTLTSVSNSKILAFANYLNDINKPIWVRHVLVPTINDSVKDLYELKRFIDSLDNVEKIELLPYHRMGIFKWKELGLEYKLKAIKEPTDDSIALAKEILGINY